MIYENWNGYEIILTNHCKERLQQRDVKLNEAIKEVKRTPLPQIDKWINKNQKVGIEKRGKDRFGFFVDFRDGNKIVLVSIVDLKGKSKLFVKDHVLKEVR